MKFAGVWEIYSTFAMRSSRRHSASDRRSNKAPRQHFRKSMKEGTLESDHISKIVSRQKKGHASRLEAGEFTWNP